MILSQALFQIWATRENRTAFRFLDREIQAADFLTTVERLTASFRAEIGIQKRVAFIGTNSPALAAAFVALSDLRCISIPMDPQASDDELWDWIEEVQPSHVLVTADLSIRIQNLGRTRDLGIPILDIERYRLVESERPPGMSLQKIPLETDPILMLRNPGAPGERRHCLFTHAQLQAAVCSLQEATKVEEEEVIYTPLSWSDGFVFLHGLLVPMLSGATCLVDPGWEGASFWKWLEENKPTRMVGASDFFQTLLISSKASHQALSALRSVSLKLDTLSPTVLKIFRLLKIRVAQFYGHTENLWSIVISDSNSEDPIQNLGAKGLPGFQYKLVNVHGQAVTGPDFREGALCVSGPSLMMGYYAPKTETAKKATRSVIRGDWLYTTDIFRIEGEGTDARMLLLRRSVDK